MMLYGLEKEYPCVCIGVKDVLIKFCNSSVKTQILPTVPDLCDNLYGPVILMQHEQVFSYLKGRRYYYILRRFIKFSALG
jgi:hypothetical protein